MLGGIYSDQRCPICGARFVHREPKGLFCPNHPKEKPTRYTVKFKNVQKRFKKYDEAMRFLTGLRFKTDEGTFDGRDYRHENPLGFITLAERYLEIKQHEIKPASYRAIKGHMKRAIEAWGQLNIKTIGYADLEDFILTQTGSAKTKANIMATLHAFWQWLRRRRIIRLDQMPEFPEVKYELGWRNTISKDIQQQILAEIFRLTHDKNLKIYLGIRWLSIYISLRPGELRRIKEEDIDRENGYLLIKHPKEKKAKVVPLLEEDIDLINSFPRGLPFLPFFRHKNSRPFGVNCFYKWWLRACGNLGIEGVDLYGGTRHSSAKALRESFTPEQIRRATMHSTNKAFERYFMIEGQEVLQVYQKASGQPVKGKILEFQKDKQDNEMKGKV